MMRKMIFKRCSFLFLFFNFSGIKDQSNMLSKGKDSYEEVDDDVSYITTSRPRFLYIIIGVLVLIVIGLSLSLAYFGWARSDRDSVLRLAADWYPEGCVFVGHISADTDSVCTALAAAELYKGSYVASDEINRETQYVFEVIGLPSPTLMEDLTDKNDRIYCLVDHNQVSQSPVAKYDIPRDQMKGIIDHHAIQAGVMTHEKTISVDIRSWGCTSTILWTQYELLEVTPSFASAKCMLSAILSDTVGLTSSSTREQDFKAVEKLSSLTATEDVQAYYFQMGSAKSNISGLTHEEVVTIDSKVYQLDWADGSTCPMTWGTFETFTPEDVLDNYTAYWQTVVDLKTKSGDTLYFFSIVNTYLSSQGILTNVSWLFLASDDERLVISESFGIEVKSDDILIDISPRTSRKSDFIPPVDDWVRAHVESDLPTFSDGKRKTLSTRRSKIESSSRFKTSHEL